MKLRAQVLSDLGSVFFKELHFGVYSCLFSYTSSTKQQKAFEQNTCRDLSVQNFPTPQVKLQGQFKWKRHKFRQIKVILSTIKKKKTHSCLCKKIIHFSKMLLHILEPLGTALICAETIYGDFYSFIYSFIKYGRCHSNPCHTLLFMYWFCTIQSM